MQRRSFLKNTTAALAAGATATITQIDGGISPAGINEVQTITRVINGSVILSYNGALSAPLMRLEGVSSTIFMTESSSGSSRWRSGRGRLQVFPQIVKPPCRSYLVLQTISSQ